jgi:glutamate synthase (NADPH) small chain
MVDGRFQKVEGTDFELECRARAAGHGLPRPEAAGLLDQLGVELDARGNVARDDRYATNVDGVFVAGDMGRGQSLIVWAIAEGRACAAAVEQVRLVRRWYDIPPPGTRVGQPEWNSYTYFTWDVP